MRRSAAALAAALLAGTAAATPAQRPAALRDSIAAIADTAALRNMAEGADDDDAALQLRCGFALLRLHELTGRPALLPQARRAFQRARSLAPGDVDAELGLGLTLARIADAEDADPPRIVVGRAFAAALGRDARSQARDALERALALEPALADAAAALADVALRTHDPDALRAARAALDRTTAGSAASPASWLARARVALALGDPDDAAAAARRAHAAGAHPAAARHALAVALLRTDGREADGATEYFRAAGSLDATTTALFADELRELWTGAEREQWEAAGNAQRPALLRRFWDVRASLAGTSIADRLAAHQRRLATAFQQYRRKTRWGAPPANALLLERPDARFDDRGVILLRHGPPLDIVRTLAPDVPPNESWLYTAPDGRRFLLHFAEYGSLFGAPGGGDARDSGGYADYVLLYDLPCAPAWVGDRVGYDHRLNPLLRRCSTFDRKSISGEVRRDALAALATDSDPPRFDREIAFDRDVWTFRGADGSTDVVAAVAVPAGSLAERNSALGSVRGLALALAVIDTAAGAVARADTTAWSADDAVVAVATVALPPVAEAALRIVVRDAGDPRNGRLRGGAIALPDYGDGTLALSDLVLARDAAADDARDAWRRGGTALRLAPGAAFDAGTFRVFFEVYGLTAGETWTTDIRVERRRAGIRGAIRSLFAGPPIRLRFQDTAAPDDDGAVRVLHTVTADLDDGAWMLHVDVTDERGRSASRERPFSIRSPHRR